MNKLTATALLVASFIGCSQPDFANAHHGINPNLVVSGYAAQCQADNQGVVVADSRNINVGGHQQQVVHMKAQGQTFAEVAIFDAGSTSTLTPFALTQPIQFTVRNGNANWFNIIVFYNLPDSTTPVGSSWVTPTSKITGSNLSVLTSLGQGKFAIPVGNGGIPFGAIIGGILIQQGTNPNNCNNHRTDFNEIYINGYPVGITTGSSACGTSCGGGEGDASQDASD